MNNKIIFLSALVTVLLISSSSNAQVNQTSISCSPCSAGTNNLVKFPISIIGNQHPISAWGVWEVSGNGFTFDTSVFQYQATGRGTLTQDWGALDGNEISPGVVRLGGVQFYGTEIPSGSSGSIAEVVLEVTCIGCVDGRTSQVCAGGFIDDIRTFTPDPVCVTFTYSSSGGGGGTLEDCSAIMCDQSSDCDPCCFQNQLCTGYECDIIEPGFGMCYDWGFAACGCSGAISACGAGCESDAQCPDVCSGSFGSYTFRDEYCASSCMCSYNQYDPDTSSARCNACTNTRWNIGGETSLCCGDDGSEWPKTETPGADVPTGYSDDHETCCSADNMCAVSRGGDPDRCFSYGSASDDAIPYRAYCNAGTWEGGDARSAACTAIAGSNRWDIGGEVAATTCCGDDSNEYMRQCTGTPNAGVSCGTGRACCNSNTDCMRSDVCYAQGSCYSAFGYSYCDSGDWRDPDSAQSRCVASCDRTSGDDGIGWGLGGQIAQSNCCGDDASEYRRNRNAGTDSTYTSDSSDNACCTAAGRCVHSSTCYSIGGVRGTIPNANWCSGGTWYGGDASSNACGAIVGSGNWNLGGEDCNGASAGDCSTECCGDDSSEFNITRVAGTDSTYVSDSTDDGCCSANDNCIYSSTCYNSDTTRGSVPNANYCNAGTWEGGDARQSACDAIAGSGYWNIGGETAASECCGDDNNEFNVTEKSGADAPLGYNDDTQACCDPGTDCNHNDICTAAGDDDGSAWCCSTSDESCTANTWYGADAYQSACTDLVASGRWSLGGEVAATTCCGDDSGENRRTCQDGGAGACTESTDDVACCNNADDCVYSNVCYADQALTPNGNWICDLGTWMGFGITVNVLATPATATSTWQNTDATANVECIPNSPAVQCDTNSFALYTSSTNIASCSTNYANYNLPDPQTISSHLWVCGAAMDTLGNADFSSPVQFLIDKTLPTASLNPLPAWTTQNSVVVGWSGWDNPSGGSGIDYFELQYRNITTDGTVIQGWTAWTTSPANGSLPFSNLQNNITYEFRVRARDNAGNIGGWSAVEGISVDLVDPTCDMADLPVWTTNAIFAINWSGFDDESGVASYDVQARAGAAGCGIPTTWGILDGLDNTPLTSHSRGYQDGCQYFFRCSSNDVAGRTGAWSAVKNTTVDTTLPISWIEPLPEWQNMTSFNVSWSGTGVNCYDIQWSDDNSTWNDWLSCVTNMSAVFGPSSPANVTDNTTYYFRSRGTDAAGQEAWSSQPDANTTIDLTAPMYTIRAEDINGSEITGYMVNVDTIVLKSNATDSASGVASHQINYTLVLGEGNEITNTAYCGSAPPYGGLSECTVSVDFSESIMIQYQVTVMDRAGNVNTSSIFTLGTHPLANFARHRISLIVGESGYLKVYVRNTQSGSDNITIILTSTLPIVPHFLAIGDFSLQNNTWVGDEIDLINNNRTIIVKNINPGQLKKFDVIVWSTEPQISTYHTYLNATSALNPSMIDSDEASVRISYPVFFPGLNEWSILILIIIAAFAYFVLGKNEFS